METGILIGSSLVRACLMFSFPNLPNTTFVYHESWGMDPDSVHASICAYIMCCGVHWTHFTFHFKLETAIPLPPSSCHTHMHVHTHVHRQIWEAHTAVSRVVLRARSGRLHLIGLYQRASGAFLWHSSDHCSPICIMHNLHVRTCVHSGHVLPCRSKEPLGKVLLDREAIVKSSRGNANLLVPCSGQPVPMYACTQYLYAHMVYSVYTEFVCIQLCLYPVHICAVWSGGWAL